MKERKSSEAGSKEEADNQQRICGADASIALGGALGFSNPGAQMFTHKRVGEHQKKSPWTNTSSTYEGCITESPLYSQEAPSLLQAPPTMAQLQGQVDHEALCLAGQVADVECDSLGSGSG